jgi:hypothetical protein
MAIVIILDFGSDLVCQDSCFVSASTCRLSFWKCHLKVIVKGRSSVLLWHSWDPNESFLLTLLEKKNILYKKSGEFGLKFWFFPFVRWNVWLAISMLIGFVGFLQQYVRLRDLIPTKLSVAARNASIPSKMSSNSFVSTYRIQFRFTCGPNIYTLYMCGQSHGSRHYKIADSLPSYTPCQWAWQHSRPETAIRWV